MNVWGCAEVTGGSAVRKYEERWRRWEQQHAFLNCTEMAASPTEAECQWCCFFERSEFMVWISECETVKFLNLCRYLGMPRVHMKDMYATPYITHCVIVEFIGLNGMLSKLLQGPSFPYAGALGRGFVPVQIPSTHCSDVFQEQLSAGGSSEQGLPIRARARSHQGWFCPGSPRVQPGVMVGAQLTCSCTSSHCFLLLLMSG